jgi:hypothetical protein
MKKLSICVVLFSLFTSAFTALHAQSDAFESNRFYLSIGYGQEAYNAKLIYSKSERENYKFSSIGPVTLKMEYGVAEGLGIGVVLGYSTSSVNWTETSNSDNQPDYYYKFSMQKITAVARLNWHFFTDESWDTYAGIGVGYKQSTWDFDSNDSWYDEAEVNGLPVAMSLSMGVRYYFNPKFGLFFETGMGHGYVQGGLQVKI